MPDKPRLWTGDFILLVVISFLAFSVCQALNNGVPLYLADLGESTAFAGALLLDFSGCAALTRVFIGRVVDRHGRRKTMIVGGMVMVAGTALAVIFPASQSQIAMRALQGIGFACVTTAASTASADVLPESRLGEGVGYFSLGQSLGMAIGPSLGVLLTTFVWRESLFLGTAAIAAACLVCTCCSTYERHPDRLPATSAYRLKCERAGGQRRKQDEKPASDESLLSSVFVKSALSGALPMFVFSLANAIPTSFTALFAAQRGLANPGLFFVLGAISMTAIRFGAARLFDIMSPRVLFLISMGCGVVQFVLLACAQSEAVLYVAGVFFGLAMGLSMPLLMSIAVKATEPRKWGAANSLVFLAIDLGVGTGGVIWGSVADAWGFTPVMIGGAVLMVAAYALSLVTFPREHRRKG